MSLLQSLSTANSEYSERGSKDLLSLLPPPPGALERVCSSLGLLSPEEDEVGCRNRSETLGTNNDTYMTSTQRGEYKYTLIFFNLAPIQEDVTFPPLLDSLFYSRLVAVLLHNCSDFW